MNCNLKFLRVPQLLDERGEIPRLGAVKVILSFYTSPMDSLWLSMSKEEKHIHEHVVEFI
jgi:hypothetical protein